MGLPHLITRRRLVTQVTKQGANASKQLLIKLYLYNVSRINIDVYYDIVSALKRDRLPAQEETRILNVPHFSDENLILYKYFQYVHSGCDKGKSLKLMLLLYNKKLREYNDKKIYFYNSCVHVHNYVFEDFFYYHSNFSYLRRGDGRSVHRHYTLHTDFFLYALDFYLFHLSKNCKLLNIEQLNVLSNIYANVSISPDGHSGDEEAPQVGRACVQEKTITKDNSSIRESIVETKANNKICLLFIHISRGIIAQTQSYIGRKNNTSAEDVTTPMELTHTNVKTCKTILNKLLNKSASEQHREYFILKKKYQKKLLNVNALKNYLNSVKYLDIINIKKYVYMILYLYFNSFIFNKSVYFSSLIFYILQKYNLQHTYLFNILFIKFNLFLLNYKTLNEYNKGVLLDSLGRYIDSLLTFRIKQSGHGKIKTKQTHISPTGEYPDELFCQIYNKEFAENVYIYKELHEDEYKCRRNNPKHFTYFENAILNFFKYLYQNVTFVEGRKIAVGMNSAEEENVTRMPKIFVEKKYNKFCLTWSEHFLSNVVLLSNYVQNCLPLLFSFMQGIFTVGVKHTRQQTRRDGIPMLYKRNIFISCNELGRSTQSRFAQFTRCGHIDGKNPCVQKNGELNPFSSLLKNIYRTFKDGVVNARPNDEDKITTKPSKCEAESIMFRNIKKNSNNKIRTSLTHYYVSSSFKKISQGNLLNEKNILTFYCDIYFNNNIVEVDGPKHFLLYYNFQKNADQGGHDGCDGCDGRDGHDGHDVRDIQFGSNCYPPFIAKHRDMFDFNFVFPFFFNNANVMHLKDRQSSHFYFYNDKSIKKNFFLYINGYFVKHINCYDRDITSFKYLHDVLFRRRSDFHVAWGSAYQ
ncbi:conserved Plasmodium protein, unknown function [Plasmodium knowlesi strain H]|uniref:Uncharacterized protein n=3 Tax=Plasmodium knowlesi TaxID=5850 RepID=A0A5K1VKJ3_PLAKH|nr:conserved Plasmodium protein, unknown function [Plasmodium knowlesi strain H]OTN66313.1 Uncharacterized protein PKNOH_S09539600 [Plasmodium knowlesi]CAA9989917.1 conserved Plasmodium protein, unknown function [Plasmodium knowlesi strain H]SBO24487.1 conserved Plasmodium protein, unknown function [Plasmodium knowlesi strain H]SBO26476.1 conserved Plasmodium protein, unknown function [Plasmodium knowlesi strain H]VVS79391.1 conserved Plasmodium protein, unknown function [Plasmodium knowlesi s|eukprot:XP_002259933.1 hypothetical protein, conserved in Plasmodium species [Plasmodium knowlesi strain H]